MKFRHAMGLFLEDMQADGRITSPNTIRTYVFALEKLAEDVANRDPRTVGREDIKRCLRRWPNTSSKATCRSIMVSFFDWTVEEGIRDTNPARQTPRPRVRKAPRYRFTLDETIAVVHAASDTRERRAIHLGVFAGLRNSELRGVTGTHFQRAGYVWVSKDIGKGGKERWIPVLPELQPVVEEILATVATDEHVLHALRNTRDPDLKKRPCAESTLVELVQRVAKRAGIIAEVGPHTLRHAFTDYIARSTGDVRIAQALLGHANLATTQVYLGKPTLDELTLALRNRPAELLMPTPPTTAPDGALGQVTGITLPNSLASPVAKFPQWLVDWLDLQATAIRAYEEAFRAS